jgi:hypothetical protein
MPRSNDSGYSVFALMLANDFKLAYYVFRLQCQSQSASHAEDVLNALLFTATVSERIPAHYTVPQMPAACQVA